MHFNLPYSTIELKKSRLEILIGKIFVRVMVLNPKNQSFYFTHSSYVLMATNDNCCGLGVHSKYSRQNARFYGGIYILSLNQSKY